MKIDDLSHDGNDYILREGSAIFGPIQGNLFKTKKEALAARMGPTVQVLTAKRAESLLSRLEAIEAANYAEGRPDAMTQARIQEFLKTTDIEGLSQVALNETGNVIGFVLNRLHLEAPDTQVLKIVRLTVDPNAAKQKVIRQLLVASARAAEQVGAAMIALDITEEDEGMLPLLEALKFQLASMSLAPDGHISHASYVADPRTVGKPDSTKSAPDGGHHVSAALGLGRTERLLGELESSVMPAALLSTQP